MAEIAAPTARKREILELVAAGYATKEIAAALGISGAAVDKHLRQLFRRYAVPNRAALVGAAFRRAHLV
jgi:DNA-binding CsgD family transcriptional regulator